MQFSIEIKDDVFPVVILRNETQKTEVVIYTFGALLNAFVIDGRQNIIDGFTNGSDVQQNITNAFNSAKLSPFVCRIKDGEYIFKDKNYKTGKFFLGEEAIHGLLYDALFTITDSGADDTAVFVKLEYFYTKKEEGFPFEYSCEITYRLQKNNQLFISTSITNKSAEAMPLCDGWHPYFKFNQSINNLLLKINAEKIVEFDERLLPTGKISAFNNFQTEQKLNETIYDNCFLLKNTSEAACIIKDEKNHLQLTIHPSEAYPYLQIYTPPHRKSVAIENLSAAPDAFNNKIGLTILHPAESKTFTTMFQAEFY